MNIFLSIIKNIDMDKEQRLDEIRKKLATAEPSEIGGLLSELFRLFKN